MTKKENPLPKPPNSAFGRKNRFEQQDEQSALLADRLAGAMAEGKLDEFIKQEMPDNEYARNLTNMMMGMTGMLPMGGAPTDPTPQERQPRPSETLPGDVAPPEVKASTEVLDEVRKAIEGNDVKSLMHLLQQEHSKRSSGSESGPAEEAIAAPSPPQPAIDKDHVDTLLQIAKDNGVSVDWLILRAIKVYVQEYQKTGRL